MIYDLTPDETTTKLILTPDGVQILQSVGGGAFVPLSHNQNNTRGDDCGKNDGNTKAVNG